MATKRPGRRTLPLGESWAVDDGETDGLAEDIRGEGEDESDPPALDIRRSSSRTRESQGDQYTGPELAMPSVEVEMAESTTSVTMRGNRNLPVSEVLQHGDMSENRRRSARQSPEKQGTTQSISAGRTAPTKGPQNAIPANSAHLTVKEQLAKTLGTISGYLVGLLRESLSLLRSILPYLVGLLGKSFILLQPTFALILTGLVLVGLGKLALQSLPIALSPICALPGSSLILPFCAQNSDYNRGASAEFDQLMRVQSNFEKVMEDSAGGSSLRVDMKRGEASVRDLRQLVRFSSLHSRNELVLEFDGFIETARIASYDLLLFNSHIGRAVDSVLASTRWTTQELNNLEQQEKSRGAVVSFMTDKVLSFIVLLHSNEARVLDQYIRHTRVIEEEIHKLIAEAQALLHVLNNLEDRIDVIHGIVTRDDEHAQAAMEEVLAKIWTMVGGNRSKLSKVDKQRNLLSQVNSYRQSAYAHVSGTILRLQEMGVGLEDLRERVAAPELLRDRTNIPLSVHIDNIQRGVERLELGRENAREVESGRLQQTIERTRANDRYIAD